MKERLKKHPIIFAIVSFIVMLIVFSVIAVLVSTSYSIYLDFGTNRDIANLSVKIAPEETPLEYHEITNHQGEGDIVEVTDIKIEDNFIRIKIHALKTGRASLHICFTMKDADGNPVRQENGMIVLVNHLKG
ncbi:MAG: hypothetical protein MJ092_01465, partial [Lachnospiraceae bacterium]|nr:hypothetical protein [Lachnospiraceae bacterium]